VVVTASDLMVHKRRLGFESAYTATRLYCCWLCKCRSRASQPRCHGASLAVANSNAVHPLYRRFRAPLTRPLSSASVAIKIAETRQKTGMKDDRGTGTESTQSKGNLPSPPAHLNHARLRFFSNQGWRRWMGSSGDQTT
jgi:hypothetical protein